MNARRFGSLIIGSKQQDLRELTSQVGLDMTEEQLRGMIAEFDRDNDGAITPENFAAIMKRSSLY